jgi:hypothetical protein
MISINFNITLYISIIIIILQSIFIYSIFHNKNFSYLFINKSCSNNSLLANRYNINNDSIINNNININEIDNEIDNKNIVKLDNVDLNNNRILTSSTSTSESNYKGVAVTLFLGSPKWFQNRFSMMVNNINHILPNDWIIQIFYSNKKMALEAIKYPGIKRLEDKGKVILTEIPEKRFGKNIRKKNLMIEPWLWENMIADRVLMFGGNCHIYL